MNNPVGNQTKPDIRRRMTALALQFPTLSKNVPGVSPWNAEKLDHWLVTSRAATAGSRCAVQFLLYVWDPGAQWQSGTFSLRDAYGRWDQDHWAVLERFIRCPFFP
jgi:hypothetical protein